MLVAVAVDMPLTLPKYHKASLLEMGDFVAALGELKVVCAIINLNKACSRCDIRGLVRIYPRVKIIETMKDA